MTNDQNDWTRPGDAREALIKALVEETDLSPLQAKELVAEHGTDRDKVFRIARTFKAEG